MPRDPFIREKFTREQTAARKFAEEYFERYPKDRGADRALKARRNSRRVPRNDLSDAIIKAAVDLHSAGVDRSLLGLEFHVTDHDCTGLYLWRDFPVPPRRWHLLNIKINATMLHDKPLLCARLL